MLKSVLKTFTLFSKSQLNNDFSVVC